MYNRYTDIDLMTNYGDLDSPPLPLDGIRRGCGKNIWLSDDCEEYPVETV